MRRLMTAFCFVVLCCMAIPSTARCELGTPSRWFHIVVHPWGAVMHPDGSIWVGTAEGVYRYDQSGVLLGQVSTVSCNSLALAPNGDVVLLDYWTRDVLRFTSGGAFVRSFANPAARAEGGRVRVDGADRVYVLYFTSGSTASALAKFDAFGNLLGDRGGLNGSDGLAIIGNTLYVSEYTGNVIHKFSNDLQPAGSFPLAAQFATGLDADRDGNLISNDFWQYSLSRVTTAGTVLETITSGGPAWLGYLALWNPVCTVQAPDGTYFVVDHRYGNVVVFNEHVTPARTTTFGAIKAGTR